MTKGSNIFLNQRFIYAVIVTNLVILFIQESGINNVFVNIADVVCTIIFLFEMISKQVKYGVKGYWTYNHWNKMDGALVIISLPSIVSYLLPVSMLDLSFLLVLRVLRVFRAFRVFHIFPHFGQLVKNLHVALKDSLSVFIGFVVLILVFALISCSFFHEYAPQYFSSPVDSIYSIFRMCTVEGWYEIPDAVASNVAPWVGHFVRIYFCILLVVGGIIGVSIVNSIFVDAMVSDNNDDIKVQLDDIQKELVETKKSLEQMKKILNEKK